MVRVSMSHISRDGQLQVLMRLAMIFFVATPPHTTGASFINPFDSAVSPERAEKLAVRSSAQSAIKAGVMPTGRFATFDPTSVPFAHDANRFRPLFYSYRALVHSFILEESRWLESYRQSSQYTPYTTDNLTSTCPFGTTIMRVEFVAVGVPYGWSGPCPADYNPDLTGRRTYFQDVCKSDTTNWGFHAHLCNAEDAYSLVHSRCVGKKSCKHLMYEKNYTLDCPRESLMWKSLAVVLSCGYPVISNVMPDRISYAHGQILHLGGARGQDPGAFLDVDRTLVIRVLSGPDKGTVLVNSTFVSQSVMRIPALNLRMTNYNITAMVSIWYDGAGSNEVPITIGLLLATNSTVNHDNCYLQLPLFLLAGVQNCC